MGDEMLSDLNSIGRFMEAQVAGRGATDCVAAFQTHHGAMVARIQNVQGVSFELATRMTEAVNAGPWTSEQQRSLNDAISRIAHRGHSAVAQDKLARKGFQHFLNFEQFLSEKEWEHLRGPALRTAKINQLCSRAWSLGLTCPTEPTVLCITRILVACAPSVMAREEIKTAYDDIKWGIKQFDKKRRHPHAHLLEYPESPTKLPPQHFAFEKPDDADRPVRVDAPSLMLPVCM